MVRRPIIPVVLVALALSACEGESVIAQHHRPGIQSSFAYGGGGRDMTVVIHGNSFQLPKNDVDQAIVDAMQGSNAPPPTHFTTQPSANARRDYRVVLLFEPPVALGTSALCADPGRLASGPRRDGRVRLLAAFCWKDRLMSEVSGNLPVVASPRDPAFRRMVSRMTFELIPFRDPADAGEGCRLPVC